MIGSALIGFQHRSAYPANRCDWVSGVYKASSSPDSWLFFADWASDGTPLELCTNWELTGYGRFAYSAPPVRLRQIVRVSWLAEGAELADALASGASGPV